MFLNIGTLLNSGKSLGRTEGIASAAWSDLVRYDGMQAMSQLNWRRHQERMHRGWYVCHPSTQENGDREGLSGCCQQGKGCMRLQYHLASHVHIVCMRKHPVHRELS